MCVAGNSHMHSSAMHACPRLHAWLCCQAAEGACCHSADAQLLSHRRKCRSSFGVLQHCSSAAVYSRVHSASIFRPSRAAGWQHTAHSGSLPWPHTLSVRPGTLPWPRNQRWNAEHDVETSKQALAPPAGREEWHTHGPCTRPVRAMRFLVPWACKHDCMWRACIRLLVEHIQRQTVTVQPCSAAIPSLCSHAAQPFPTLDHMHALGGCFVAGDLSRMMNVHYASFRFWAPSGDFKLGLCKCGRPFWLQWML
jgi:hypothetical protein